MAIPLFTTALSVGHISRTQTMIISTTIAPTVDKTARRCSGLRRTNSRNDFISLKIDLAMDRTDFAINQTMGNSYQVMSVDKSISKRYPSAHEAKIVASQAVTG